MKCSFKKFVLSAACVAALGGVTLPAYAVNWVMLQGTEPADSAPQMKMFGFVQALYEKDASNSNQYVGTPGNNYSYIAPMLIGPDLKTQESFNVRHAVLGARGTGFPLDSNVNYLVTAEFGNSAVTHPGGSSGSSPRLLDASITLNHIPGAHIRVGAFKTPGAEEAMQAPITASFVNFSEVTNQLLLERFPNDQFTHNRNNVAGFNYTDDGATSPYNRFNKPVGAFRDVGVEVFDAFHIGSWQHTYAAMYGNGNGVNFTDSDNNKDLYLYWSSELVFGGKGPYQQGLKLFAWSQTGKRTLYNPPSGDKAPNDTEPSGKTAYKRDRSGLGVVYRGSGFHASAEYMQGKGMIFLGPDNPTFTITAPCTDATSVPVSTCSTTASRPLLADGRNGKANGWYVAGGWDVPSTNWELDARYDVYDRLTDAKKLAGPCDFHFRFKTATLGAQYHFNKLTRVTFNAAKRDFNAVDCPAPAPGGNPNNNLNPVGNRYSVELTHLF